MEQFFIQYKRYCEVTEKEQRAPFVVCFWCFLLSSVKDILVGSNISGKYLYWGRQTMKCNWKILLCVPLCNVPCSFVDEKEEGSRFRMKEVENTQIKPSISLVKKKKVLSQTKRAFFFEKLSRTWVSVIRQLLIQRSLHYLWNVRQPVTSAVVSELDGMV